MGNQNIHEKKLGIALVGLGQYSEEELAPALEKTELCKLVGIVTGTSEKVDKWKRKYSIKDSNIYNYSNFDNIKDNADIDIVYIVLPNSMHAEFTIRAANAGKHVICEKPMAVSEQECRDMINACQRADRLLSIGYRLHFEPFNLAMAEIGVMGNHGAVKRIVAKHSRTIEPGVWRLNNALAGGGPLMDVGIYCVQAAIYVMGENPIAITAQEGKKTDLRLFKEVEQSLTWQMEFASGAIAECETSYTEEMDLLRVETEKEWFELKPAFAYRGIQGRASHWKFSLPEVPQQTLQMDDFAKCVLKHEKSKVPGEMGLRDVKILLAIYEAARSGKKINIGSNSAAVNI